MRRRQPTSCSTRDLVVGLLVDAVFEVFDTMQPQVEPVPVLGTRIRGPTT
jgi:chemotaxis signal transduction protein